MVGTLGVVHFLVERGAGFLRARGAKIFVKGHLALCVTVSNVMQHCKFVFSCDRNKLCHNIGSCAHNFRDLCVLCNTHEDN